MAESRVQRVAYVETDRSEAEARETYAVCGRIRGIYPWKTGEQRASTHFFIEFEDESSVKRARALHARDFRAHTVAYSPQMVAHFEGVSRHGAATKVSRFDRPASLPQRPQFSDADLGSAGPSSARTGSLRKTKSSSSQMHSPVRDLPVLRFSDVSSKNKENIGKAGPSLPLKTSLSFERDSSQPGSYANTPVKDRKVPHEPKPSAPVSTQPPIKAEPGADATIVTARPLSLSQSTAPVSDQPTAPTMGVGAIPFPCITLFYGGQAHSCRLDALTGDPTDIIFILSQAAAQASERDKWMMVAGYYRSKRNISAAISVVTAMVDVMMSPAVGLSKDDLKPCFLMLASCNTDLSREARKSGPEGAEAAREHMDQAKKYFQLVYGTHYPQEGSPRSGPSASPQRLSLLQRVDRRPQVGPPADEPSRMHTLERELQSLRAKHTNQVGQLADAHTARRKAEEELDVERTLRRTAGREADAELQSAQRSARFALDQCRREVEGRRRAEGRAVELHDELAAVQDRLCAQLREAQDKDRKARECFARLGTLFTKAAQGELDDPTAPMFAGPSRSARGTPMPPMPPVPPAARSSSRSTRATPPPPPLPMGPPAKRRRTESA